MYQQTMCVSLENPTTTCMTFNTDTCASCPIFPILNTSVHGLCERTKQLNQRTQQHKGRAHTSTCKSQCQCTNKN
eukprot:m.368067 g.368067  ORF g.368067 m.368067 type:complete len:75 (-) comp43524_c0_seq1:58-282(-)